MSEARFLATFADGFPLIFQARQMHDLREAVRHFRIRETRILTEDVICPISRSIIEDAAVVYYNDAIFRMIVMGLIIRRQNLLRNALRHLPSSETKDLLGPIDTQTAGLGRQLLRCDVVDRRIVAAAVPDLGSPDCDESMYFLVRCNRRATQTLYDLGYRNVNEPRGMGDTPLAALEVTSTAGHRGEYRAIDRTDALSQYVAMCAWYDHRAASLYTEINPVTQSTMLHQIARFIGRAVADSSAPQGQRRDEENEEDWQSRISDHCKKIIAPLAGNGGYIILRELFSNGRLLEQYTCFCCLNGRLPFDVLVNETVRGESSARRIRLMAGALLRSQGLWTTKVSALHQRTVSGVIRACSFACLGLRHSCGAPNTSGSLPIGETSITETDFDSAVSKLLTNARSLDWRMEDCLSTYWESSMEELRNLSAHTSTATNHDQT
ncbi:hypothetical protein BDW74DRAFT_177732 [Aspergillus multicolor]|uniref:uncharacterized protein n=1 Tax=Aspergillus multicolor TaxID=41759 RepID=UPI003CCE4A4D